MVQAQKKGLRETLCKALSLKAGFYENARNRPRTYRIALMIVILAALSHALGSAVILVLNRVTLPNLLIALFIITFSIVGGYYLWTWIIWKLGHWLKPNAPTYLDLSIPIGFAYAPQTLNFLTLIPLLGRPIVSILAVWSLLAAIVAVREGLDISTSRAVIICLVGWTSIQLAISFIQILISSE